MAASRPIAPQPFGGGKPGSRRSLLAAPVRWPRPARLAQSPSSLKGIGPNLETRAQDAGVESVLDLLWRIPGTYGETPEPRLLADLEPGVAATVLAEVVSRRKVRVRRRGFSVVEAVVRDSSRERKAVWFNQPWVEQQLEVGSSLLIQGRLETNGFVVAAHEGASGAAAADAITSEPARWNSASEDGPPGLKQVGIHGRHGAAAGVGPGRWRKWAWLACRQAADLPEPLPSRLIASRSLPGAAAAVREAHFPASEESSKQAIRRLAYEELFLHQVVLRRGRIEIRDGAPPARALEADPAAQQAWLSGLPFELTGDQRTAIDDISADLSQEKPMRRLLMGEVGSGKTVVAIEAMVRVARCGAQSAFMAPTEVLADQHMATIGRLLEGSGVRVARLTGSTSGPDRRAILSGLSSREVDILVGTHALLEEPVEFRQLALCVIDEEHRFGVRQRTGLDRKTPAGRSAHFLHMTATPIPRTLSLTTYGDLDMTELRELPAGRKPVRTEVLGESQREIAFRRLRTEVDAGRQAFVVCPLVSSSASIQARAAAEEAERLRGGELRDFEVGLIHGQMNADQKSMAMAAFEDGRTDVLVATTVIEVGIDVPNATVMVIEGAERFGISQLHQLRGRIGRGSFAGHCFLVTGSTSAGSRRRVAALVKESDGFRLAEFDLETRGEGEITGTRQHGLPRFRVARLPRDHEILELARKDLDQLVPEGVSLDDAGLGLTAEIAGQRFGPEGAMQ